jgi:adenosylhomocysteine nucleosidase
MFGIITAVDAERDAVLERIESPQEYSIYGIKFYEGVIGKIRCIMAMAGVGKVNAARCAQLMIDKFSPARIVNIGSAGALHPKVRIGDVIISTACIQHDVDLTAFGLRKGFFSETDGFIPADPELMELCAQAMEQTLDNRFRIFTGTVATGDQFNDSPTRKEELFQEFGAYCIEMEGAAVAQVAAMCQVPFVIIRSISDQPDDDTLNLYETYKQQAAVRCALFLVNLVTGLQERYKEA